MKSVFHISCIFLVMLAAALIVAEDAAWLLESPGGKWNLTLFKEKTENSDSGKPDKDNEQKKDGEEKEGKEKEEKKEKEDDKIFNHNTLRHYATTEAKSHPRAEKIPESSLAHTLESPPPEV